MQMRGLSTYLLISILIVGAILRFNHIGQPLIDAFSWRETDTAMMADNYYNSNWNILCTELNWDGPGPGYQGREFQTLSYFAALLYVLVGQHDWVGRAVAVMFGLWGIFALYQLVRRVWDEQRALASAAVMALLPGSIFIERSFLPDPAMVALVTTSIWMFVVYLQTDRWHYLVLATVIGTWGFLTKITGLIVGIPMLYAMLAILSRRRMLHPSRLATLGAVAVFGLAPMRRPANAPRAKKGMISGEVTFISSTIWSGVSTEISFIFRDLAFSVSSNGLEGKTPIFLPYQKMRWT
jgi:Dolichyl-phosphate-mannose-protein mannosyltransferase